MAEAVSAAVTIFALTNPLGWSALAMSAFVVASTVAIGSYQARQAKKAARAAFEASLRDRQEVIRSATAPKPIIYGECVAGGVLTYVASTGTKKEFVHLVVTIAGHPIESIDDIYFNDESIGALDVNGDVQTGSKYYKTTTGESALDQFTISGQTYTLTDTPSSGTVNATVSTVDGDISVTVGSVVGKVVTISTSLSGYTGSQINFNYQKQTGEPLVHVVKYPNGSSVADAELVADTGGEWTTSHKGQGVAYIYIRLKYDQDIYQNGIPAMKFKVKGKKIYDPRTSTTGYSNNAALCVYDYLTSSEGFNCASSEINQSAIIAAANICDENVNITASLTQKRYTINGIISTDEKRIENLENMVLSMVGSAVWTQGKWNIYAGAYNAPSINLSDDDLTNSDGITIQSRTNRRDLFNYIKGVYVEPLKSWQATDFPAIGSATYEGYDGDEEIVRDVQFQFVTDNYRAQRLATVILQQSRLALTVQATFNLKAYHVSPSDTISLTIARYGWTNKTFRVLERTFSPDQGVKLVLKEESSAAYSWSYTGLIPITDGDDSGLLPDQRGILPPTSISATSDNTTVKELPDGTQIPRILVQWTPPQDERVLNGGYIEIEYKAASDTAWTPYPAVRGDTSLVYIEPVLANTIYYVRLRSVSSANTFSEWVYSGGGVEGQLDTTPPSAPTSVVATAAQQAIVLTWTNPIDLDLNTVEIWVNTSATLIGITKVTEIKGERFTHDNLGSQVTRYYYLRAKDHSGNLSAWTSVVSATTQKNIADQIADDIITTAAFANSITPVEIVSALPSTGNFEGRLVYLTTDNKLYRHTGSPTGSTGFTRAVDGADLTANSITAGKIAAGAISTDQLAANAITSDKIAANQIFAAGLSVASGGAGVSIAGNTAATAPDGTTITNGVYVFQNSQGLYGFVAQNKWNQNNGGGAAYFNSNYGFTSDFVMSQNGAHPNAALKNTAIAASALSGGNVFIGVTGANGGYAGYAVSGTWSPFTGSHDALLDKTVSIQVGDIVVDSEIVAVKISDSLTKVLPSSFANQKGALGVYVSRRDLNAGAPAALVDGKVIENEALFNGLVNIYDNCVINGVGEGAINVCGEGGNIEIGDLIVTSSIAGKGMKQSDDIIRSYTVAKARESVTFSTSSEIKQIACIYLCG